ncbi:Myc-type basic helix-loop-helix (bHLH) domain-containing protein, partial [Dioscorea alata]
MRRERHRRAKLSESYSKLYSILTSRSKADKNSIVQSAAVYLKELKTTKEDLYKQNKNLKHKMEDENMKIDEVKIKVQVMNPVSTIDSMIEALQCMKEMGVIAMSIQSKFSEDESTTMMTINTKV